MTVVVQGDVSAVTQAIESAVEKALLKPAAYAVIANPHEEVWRIIKNSANRIKQKLEECKSV